MTATVLRADARALPLPDASVDLICTSPPYFGLRDYRDGDGSLAGQIGSEPTPAAYVAALLDCTREWMRVLKPSGSMFVNLGDSYNSGPSGRRVSSGLGGTPQSGRGSSAGLGRKSAGQPKSLLGLPWRYALGCIDDLGLILRAEIIWAKPNGLPESVTDRVRRSHEQVFHFTRQPRYYSAVDEVREAHTALRHPPGLSTKAARAADAVTGKNGSKQTGLMDQAFNPLGKLPGSVWEIPSQPLTVPAALGTDHFAAFPMELPRRIIAGWSPPGICVACGEGRRPVHDGSEKILHRPSGANNIGKRMHNGRERTGSTNVLTVHRITGYACACTTTDLPGPDVSDYAKCRAGEPPPTRPALVVDPFGGTGTTALVASVLGRDGISFDRSMDYTRLARWRTTDPGQRAAAMQVPKPPPQADGQADLFEGIVG